MIEGIEWESAWARQAGRRQSLQHKSGTAKLWGGRFAETPDARLEAFNASVGFDVRLAREDIRGSIAHVRMLGRQGIIPAEDAAAIEAGSGGCGPRSRRRYGSALTIADEDVHTGVERRLRELIGPVAGKLHTGRSRNDQVATDFRLWTKGAILALLGGVCGSERGAARCRGRARRRGHARLHPSATGPAGPARPPPACLRRDARARRRPPARRLPPDRRLAARRRRAGRRHLPDRPGDDRRRPRLRRGSAPTALDAVSDRDFVLDVALRLRHDRRSPLAAERGDRPLVLGRVPLHRAGRRLRHRQLDHAAEEERRRGRAGAGQDGPRLRPPARAC